jgi:von Willebrand factor type D domain/Fibrinogen beta and gamma chains, C-terminal globular domain
MMTSERSCFVLLLQARFFWFVTVVVLVGGGGFVPLAQSKTVVEFPPLFGDDLLNLVFRFNEEDSSNLMLESISFQFPETQAILPSADRIDDIRLSDQLYNTTFASQTATFIIENNQRVASIHISLGLDFYLTYDSSGTNITDLSPFPTTNTSKNSRVHQTMANPFHTTAKDILTPITTSFKHQHRVLFLTSCQFCRIRVAAGCTVLAGFALVDPLRKLRKVNQGIATAYTWAKNGGLVAARKRTLKLAGEAWKQFMSWLRKSKKKPKNKKERRKAKKARKKAEKFQKEYRQYKEDAKKILDELYSFVDDAFDAYAKSSVLFLLGTLNACLPNVDTFCNSCEFFEAGSSGDPHIYTFDGLSYDCHVEGEVILAKTLSSDLLQIHGRFAPVGWAYATGTTGVVVKPRGLPMIQLSLDPSRVLHFVVDGNEQQLASGNGYQVSQESWSTTVTYPSMGLDVSVKFNGRYINVDMKVSRETLVGETLVGLFGTPNDDYLDDWMTPNGTTVSAASGPDLIFQSSYDYCKTNWCVNNASASLFTYLTDESFESFNKCDEEYDSTLETELANPPQCLIDICGSDLQCLIDGIALGRAGVENLRTVQDSQLCYPRASKSCYFSCADALATTCDATPGLYTICPHTNAVPQTVYCDQLTDGGGWMLLYSYKHVAGENKPTNGSTIPLDPDNGYSHFHLNQLSGYDESVIESVRFYCRTSGHERIMHFKNAHPVVGSIAYHGDSNSNRPKVWSDQTCFVTAYPDHSALLPASTQNTYAITDSQDGFRTFPFWVSQRSHWTIASKHLDLERYECEDFVGNYAPEALSTDTLHNVWVKVKEKCCAFGYGHFTGHVANYDVSIRIDENGVRTDYPNLSCGHMAYMTPMNSSTVGRVEWLEVLDYGLNGCINRGKIALVAGNDKLWTYTYTASIVQAGPLSFECNHTCSLS